MDSLVLPLQNLTVGQTEFYLSQADGVRNSNFFNDKLFIVWHHFFSLDNVFFPIRVINTPLTYKFANLIRLLPYEQIFL